MSETKTETNETVVTTTIPETITPGEPVPVIIDNTPPLLFERDKNGLLKHIQHKFTSEGRVDWRAMVPIKYLYINPQLNKENLEKKYNKKLEEIDIEKDKVEDEDLVIYLDGLKYLAQLRGYVSVGVTPIKADLDHCTTVCTIWWIPNFETEFKELRFDGYAGANQYNTNGFGRNYLPEISENRAFCRCVRNSLKIEIVSREELSNIKEKGSESGSGTGPITVLKNLMSEKKVSFEDLKRKKAQEGCAEADSWEDMNDIPANQVADIIKRLRNVKTS